MCRRDGPRRRRGCHVDIPWRRIAATARLVSRGMSTSRPRRRRDSPEKDPLSRPRRRRDSSKHVRAANALREDEARRRRVGEGLARVNIVPGPPRCSPADYPRRHPRRRREWLVLRYRTYGRFSNGALTPRCYSPLLIGSPRRGRGVAATDEPRTPEHYIMKCTKSIASTP